MRSRSRSRSEDDPVAGSGIWAQRMLIAALEARVKDHTAASPSSETATTTDSSFVTPPLAHDRPDIINGVKFKAGSKVDAAWSPDLIHLSCLHLTPEETES